jgi:hypothetical protein
MHRRAARSRGGTAGSGGEAVVSMPAANASGVPSNFAYHTPDHVPRQEGEKRCTSY